MALILITHLPAPQPLKLLILLHDLPQLPTPSPPITSLDILDPFLTPTILDIPS